MRLFTSVISKNAGGAGAPGAWFSDSARTRGSMATNLEAASATWMAVAARFGSLISLRALSHTVGPLLVRGVLGHRRHGRVGVVLLGFDQLALCFVVFQQGQHRLALLGRPVEVRLGQHQHDPGDNRDADRNPPPSINLSSQKL